MSDQLIYSTALDDGMPALLSSFITGQARHETGNYTHRFFTLGKNAFGYSYNKLSKWQIQGGDRADNGVPIAQYRSVADSVHELTDWIKRRQKEGKFPKDLTQIRSASEYAMLLKKSGYYQAPLSVYVSGIVNALKKLPENIYKAIPPGGNIIVLLIIVGVAFYFLTKQNQ
ncbi:MAG TPA: glucosaminidase domain-containing protein [Chitinophagaceae bacterium]